MKKKCKYQDQNSEQTLREAIGEHYQANPALIDTTCLAQETADFFQRHDQIHVLFGCSTSFLDEARADFWTMFGTDLGVRRYLMSVTTSVIPDLYKDLREKLTAEDKQAIKQDMKANLGRAFLVPASVFLRARKMNKKWRWGANPDDLDRPLREIREEYGIRVFT